MLSLARITKLIIKEQQQKYQLFCDLDGVLVDFKNGLEKYLNAKQIPKEVTDELGKSHISIKDFENRQNKKTRKFSYRTIKQNDEEFWTSLTWTKDGQRLWNYIKKHDPMILSAPVGESRGKIIWVKTHIGLPENKIILEKNKEKYAKYNGKTGILIDDTPEKLTPFKEAGGIPIHHISTETTINLLKKMGL